MFFPPVIGMLPLVVAAPQEQLGVFLRGDSFNRAHACRLLLSSFTTLSNPALNSAATASRHMLAVSLCLPHFLQMNSMFSGNTLSMLYCSSVSPSQRACTQRRQSPHSIIFRSKSLSS
uniref:Putative secreted protein n=1 Tax=Anopheles triannulatus TaxID=58253 RepID=A0A2M4B205_9DIPT